jgi:IS30 family transposase
MEDREEIYRPRYDERLFLREIGQKLYKDKSAISRELKRGTKNKLYNPITAEANHRIARKRQSPKLEKRWSPEQVEEWLKKEYPCYPMNAKTIYNWACSKTN